MTRIIMISDTHHGGGPEGYRMQAPYIERLPELLAALGAWISETGGADLVLHGGDTVELAEPALIREAVAQLAVLPAPVRLVVGNHDVYGTGGDSGGPVAWWATLGAALFPDGVDPANPGAWRVRLPGCTLHALPTHWGEVPYRWDGGMPRACLAPADLVRLEASLAAEPDRPQLVACHAAPAGTPAAQRGRPDDGDPPPEAYAVALAGLAARHPNLRLFLSGHSHVNALGVVTLPAGTGTSAHWLTATSFSESPFDCREITFTGSTLVVRTVPMHGRLGWAAGYDWDAAWVQGRPCDRNLKAPW